MSANTSPEGPKAAPILGRDDKGRFVRGNPGGPGNPFARKTAALRSALIRRMDEEKIEQLADTLIKQAIEGDVSSARLVLQYAIGLPTQAVDPDDVDRLEWEREQRQVVTPAELHAATKGVPVAVATVTCSFRTACDAARLAEHLAERIDEIDHPEPEDEEDEEGEPDVLAMPAPVNQPQAGEPAEGVPPVNQRPRTGRRCANPGRPATPPRHPTAEPSEEALRPPHLGEPGKNGHGRPPFLRPDDPQSPNGT